MPLHRKLILHAIEMQQIQHENSPPKQLVMHVLDILSILHFHSPLCPWFPVCLVFETSYMSTYHWIYAFLAAMNTLVNPWKWLSFVSFVCVAIAVQYVIHSIDRCRIERIHHDFDSMEWYRNQSAMNVIRQKSTPEYSTN